MNYSIKKYATSAVVCLLVVLLSLVVSNVYATPSVTHTILATKSLAESHGLTDFRTQDLQELSKTEIVDIPNKKIGVVEYATDMSKTVEMITLSRLNQLLTSNLLLIEPLDKLIRGPARMDVSDVRDPCPLCGFAGINIAKPELDAALVDVKQNLLHAQGYKGAGTIVAVIDTGLDYLHKDFRYNKVPGDGEAGSRILYLCDQTLSGTSSCGGREVDRAFIESEIAANTQTVGRDFLGHGTHVTGAAAGDGSESNGVYEGMAPEADIIFVKIPITASTTQAFADRIGQALDWIFAKADALGKPVVVNMSLGIDANTEYIGGLSSADRAIWTRLGNCSLPVYYNPTDTDVVCYVTGDGGIWRNYKAVVVSAGNENRDVDHNVVTSTPSTGFINVTSLSNAGDPANSTYSYKLIPAATQQVKIQVVLPFGLGTCPADGSYVTPGNTVTCNYAQNYNGFQYEGDISISVENFRDTGARWESAIFFDFSRKGSTSGLVPQEGTYEVRMRTVSAQTATVDVWGRNSDHESLRYPMMATVDHLKNIGVPADCDCVISVGAYPTKKQWTQMNGDGAMSVSANLNDIGFFSSSGPTADGRQKPDIAAPGHVVASALSRDCDYVNDPECLAYDIKVPGGTRLVLPGGKYAIAAGTSMSSPIVAGVVATLMQRAKAKGKTIYTMSEIKDALRAAARTDGYTGTVPNYRWGWGKLDVYKFYCNCAGLSTKTAGDKAVHFEFYSLSGQRMNFVFDQKTMQILSAGKAANGVYLGIKTYASGRREVVKFVIKR